jgi:STE24 endopeptidase
MLLCMVSTGAGLGAQSVPQPVSSGTEMSAQTPSSNGGSVAPADQPTKRGTDAYRLPRGRFEKAVAFARTEYILYFISVAWGILVLVFLLQMGVVAKLRDLAERWSPNRFMQSLVFIPGLLLVLALLRFPLSLYGHRLALRYELSIQGWGSWLWDWCKAEFLFVALGFLLIWILFSVIRWKPQTWWLYFGLALVPIALFIFFISPWFFDPLFNTFRPLQEKYPALVQSIGKLTQHAGVPMPADRMFLMEASAKTNEINAYVTGFGASKRVVIWDTSIEKTTPDELLYIIGHELGHYVLGHIWKGFLFFILGAFLGAYIAFWLFRWILMRWGGVWGVRDQGDWAALAVLLLIMNVLDFVGMPIGNGISRMQEHEADVYGLEVIHGLIPQSGEVAARAFQVLGDVDLADPNPSRFITFWLYSHPPLGDRLVFAHDYDPWAKGQQPQFVK